MFISSLVNHPCRWPCIYLRGRILMVPTLCIYTPRGALYLWTYGVKIGVCAWYSAAFRRLNIMVKTKKEVGHSAVYHQRKSVRSKLSCNSNSGSNSNHLAPPACECEQFQSHKPTTHPAPPKMTGGEKQIPSTHSLVKLYCPSAVNTHETFAYRCLTFVLYRGWSLGGHSHRRVTPYSVRVRKGGLGAATDLKIEWIAHRCVSEAEVKRPPNWNSTVQ